MRTSLLLALSLALACRNKDNPDDGETSTDSGEDGSDCDGPELCNGVDDDCDSLIDEADDDLADALSFYEDADGDGFGDPDSAVLACSAPSGAVDDDSDCDDSAAEVHPEADEVCDEVDNDCDGTVDEGVELTFYADADSDGFGDPDQATPACSAPSGTVDDNTDCDDTSDAVWPGADEVCDELDNDCDGDVDEDVTTAYYADTDEDGFGDPDSATAGCSLPTGYAATGDDCDDADGDVHPDATELCNEQDDDCDGLADDADSDTPPADATTWYADADSDGFGDPDRSQRACIAPTGAVDDATDCDDASAAVNPDAPEICNDLDDDCDGSIDDDDRSLTDARTWYIDADEDGYGSRRYTLAQCDQPSGYIAAASETDCDDGDGDIHPAAAEVCNEVDDDCDGDIDDDDSDVTLTETWYEDADSDGFGDAGESTASCEQPSGYTDDSTDCDDSDGEVNPDAAEVVNGVDDDCDGSSGGGDYSPTSDTSLAGGAWEFDSLTIPSGVTVTVTGSDPLELYVLGAADIAGVLTLAGKDGAAGTYADSAAAAGGAGGGGGGANGGDGSILTTTAAWDGDGDGGGSAGTDGMIGGGGGGGANQADGDAGSDGVCTSARCGSGYTVSGGSGGSAYAAGAATLSPGSGGGGGGFARADNGDGAAGGGGGGALYLWAETIDISGTIRASGGDGGSVSDGSDGGAAGGGAGGTLWLVASELRVSGTLACTGGDGGTTAVGPSSAYGGAGGDGADGAIWLDAESLNDSGATINPTYSTP